MPYTMPADASFFSSGTWAGSCDADPEETFAGVVDVLNGYRPGYLHVVEDTIDEASPVKAQCFRRLRSAWKGIYVANGGFDAERGERAISDGSADAVAYGLHEPNVKGSGN